MLSFRFTMAIAALLCANICFAQPAAVETDTPFATPRRESKFHDFKREHFRINGRDAWVTLPANPAPGKPWLWRARFPSFHAEIDHELLKRGWHVVYINCDNLYGSAEAMKAWDIFYDFLQARHALNPKAVLSGCSRGGLFIHNYALHRPERTALIYGDTPVLDFKSWPSGHLGGRRSNADWDRLKKCYGFANDTEAFASKNIPLESAETFAAQRIPIMHVVGCTDVVVPPALNSYPFAERVRKADGRIVVYTGKGPGDGHHIKVDFLDTAVRFITENTALPDLDEGVMKKWSIPGRGVVNAFTKFAEKKQGKVVYLGGSITHHPGWQNMVSEYLRQRFPECKFEFKNIGIPSLGSNAHAFRWRHDFGGVADLVFFESAVNDNHNGVSDAHVRAAYEGVIRGILTENPYCDIITLQCAQPLFTEQYAKGENPRAIALHEPIEAHYNLPCLNFAKEVHDRLAAKQFDWKTDFKDLHPSPFGQRLYYQSIVRFFDQFKTPRGTKPTAIKLPPPLTPDAWTNAHFLPLENAKTLKDFKIDPKWRPAKGGTRKGFVDCPMLVGEKEGAEFSVDFKGTVFGMMITAGHDAGIVEWSVDNGKWQSKSSFTRWSAGLHLPWAFILEDKLDDKPHTIRIRLKSDNGKSALRIRRFLVNTAE